MLTKILCIISFFFSLCFITAPSNAGSIGDTKIKQINHRPGSIVMRFDKTFDSKCEDNGVWAILRSDETEGNQRLFSLILAAAAAGNTINISSSGCDYHNTIEQLHIQY